MSAPSPAPAQDPPPSPSPTVFFLSDYGLADEFVGVVHAVLHRITPGIAVVDLAHGVPPFDVRAGAEMLGRAVAHLGPGVVLGVVDPGVGSRRRGVALRSGDGRWFVGPDNGLLVEAAEASGGIARALTLRKPQDAPATFDGRDVFAPTAATLAAGGAPAAVGDAFDPADLVRLPPVVHERIRAGAQDGEGRARGERLRAEVTWVDRFGNVQLAAPGPDGPPEATTVVTVRLGPVDVSVRRVRTFSELDPGELGILVDANGRVALAVREGSAAETTGAVRGDVAELAW